MTDTITRPSYRSYSAMALYLKCPRQYHAKYILRLPEEPSVWSVGGTAFHQVAEWLLDGTLGESPAAHRLRDAWESAWHLAYTDVITRDPTLNPDMNTWRKANRGAEGVTWWRGHGYRMVLDFAAWWPQSGLTVLDLDGPALERRLQVDLDGVHVLAIPDALVVDEHGQVDVLDYKTGKPPKESLQLGVYKAALSAATGLDATYGLYYMARDVRAIPVDLAKWPVDKITELFVDFDTRERAGDYEPTPSKEACKFCPLKTECDAAIR